MNGLKMERPSHLDLFSGIGGATIAAEDVGWETVGFAETDRFCREVLRKHFPTIPNLGDVTSWGGSDGSVGNPFERPVDLITAGPPCQPVSSSGRHGGETDPRWLWGTTVDIIAAIKPRWFVGENPTGLMANQEGRTFGRLAFRLANLGYDVGWVRYPASAVGATHIRERIFLLAHAHSFGRTRGTGRIGPIRGSEPQNRSVLQQYAQFGAAQQRVGQSTYGLPAWVADYSWPAPQGASRKLQEYYRTDYRIVDRRDKLRALGNAMVPQQVYLILQAIWDKDPEKRVWR